MSSRAEEKQKRREERLAREQAEKAAAARRQRLTIAGAVLAGVAVIAVVVLLAGGVLGGGNGDNASAQTTPVPADQADVQLPEQVSGDITAAAKAAGCKLTNPPIEGRNHEDKTFTAASYKTNPPTSGNHFPEWAQDGVYAPGKTPPLGKLVHTLEHGRIDVQYKPGTPDHTIAQLSALLSEQSEGYHMLLFENGTDMDAQIAATAWGHSLTCPQFNNKVFDAIRTFRAAYIDRGPEDVP